MAISIELAGLISPGLVMWAAAHTARQPRHDGRDHPDGQQPSGLWPEHHRVSASRIAQHQPNCCRPTIWRTESSSVSGQDEQRHAHRWRGNRNVRLRLKSVKPLFTAKTGLVAKNSSMAQTSLAWVMMEKCYAHDAQAKRRVAEHKGHGPGTATIKLQWRQSCPERVSLGQFLPVEEHHVKSDEVALVVAVRADLARKLCHHIRQHKKHADRGRIPV
jgi:hypothetical protein